MKLLATRPQRIRPLFAVACLASGLACALVACHSASPPIESAAPRGSMPVESKPQHASNATSPSGISFCGTQWHVESPAIECHRRVESLDPLADFPKLTELDLSSARGPSKDILDLAVLAQMDGLQKRLHRLVLDDTRVTGFEALATMTSLSELSLASTYPPEGDSLDLGPLAGLPNLKRLNLSGSYVPSLDSLVGLTTLEVLDLRDSLTPGTEFPKFASLRQLKDLRLGDSPYEDESIPIANLRFLRALPQLETLDLKCRYIDGNLGAELARAKSLRKLSVCYLSDFGPLSALTGLQELTVLDAPEDLRPLSKLRALRLLHLSGSATKPARVANLAQLSQLEELTLRFRGVQPLAEVATLPRLHRLTLSLGPNDSLAPLASLPELELLNITNNVVRQVDLLAQIRSLKKLVHHHTTIPPEELLHLREQRPDLIFEPPLASDDP